MATTTTQLLIQIRADTTSAAAAIKGLETTFQSFNDVARAALPASLALAAAGAAIMGAAGAAVSTAAAFDTSMTAIRNNTNMSNADADLMRQTVLKLGAESPASLEQLGQGFMHITNLGFSAKDAVLVLDAAMKSAVSTGGNTADTANILAQAMHEFAIPAAKASETMDMLHMAAAEGNMTLEQFSNSFGVLAAWAAAVGVPLDQAAAAMSAMTRHGFDAATAATQVKDEIAHLINPSAEAKKAIEGLGTSIGKDLSGVLTPAELHAKGLTGVIDEIKASMDKAGLSVADQTAMWLKIIPNMRGGAAGFVLAGRGADDFATILADMHAKLGVTDEAFARMKDTAGFQWGVLTNKMRELGIAVGSVLLPPLIKIVDVASMVLGAFMALPTPIQTILAYAGVITGVLLTVAGALGLAAFAIGPLTVGFTALGTLFSGVAVTAIGAALSIAAAWVAVAWPVLLVVAAVGLLAAAWANNWLGIQQIFAPVVSFIQKHAAIIVGVLVLITEAVLWPITATVKLTQAVIENWGTITGVISAAVSWVGDRLNDLIGGPLHAIGEAFANVWHDIVTVVITTVTIIGDTIAGLMDFLAAHGLDVGGTGQQWIDGWKKVTGQIVASAQGAKDAASATTGTPSQTGKSPSALPNQESPTKTAAKAANNAAEGDLKKFNEAADKRKNDFEQSQVENNTKLIQLKLDQAAADQTVLGYKRQIEDLDRNSIDFGLKRLQLDEQDAVTRAKIAESGLKNNADDLTYQQQLLLAQVKAARARGEHPDMHAVRTEMKALKKEELEQAPALLIAQHNVSLAERAKSATDLTASLKTTDLERQKLAIQEAMKPFEDAAINAKRAVEDQQRVVDLAKQTFELTEQQYALQKLILEAAAKKAAFDLWMIEHPATSSPPATALPDTRNHPIDNVNRTTADRYGPVPVVVLPDNRSHPIENRYWTESPRYGPEANSTTTPSVTVGDVTIHVNGGNSDAETFQNIKDSIGSWFQQAVHQVANGARVSKGLGGNYAKT